MYLIFRKLRIIGKLSLARFMSLVSPLYRCTQWMLVTMVRHSHIHQR